MMYISPLSVAQANDCSPCKNTKPFTFPPLNQRRRYQWVTTYSSLEYDYPPAYLISYSKVALLLVPG